MLKPPPHHAYVPYYFSKEGKLIIGLLSPDGTYRDVSLDSLNDLDLRLKREPVSPLPEQPLLHVKAEHAREGTSITFAKVKTFQEN